VHEEVYIASLDLGEAALSARCLGVLRQRFTDSKRVKILEAMGLEAQGKLDEALAVYTAMLEEEPSNTVRASPPPTPAPLACAALVRAPPPWGRPSPRPRVFAPASP
jgi:hypothetical protein